MSKRKEEIRNPDDVLRIARLEGKLKAVLALVEEWETQIKWEFYNKVKEIITNEAGNH